MTPDAITAVIDGTWPAISVTRQGPWTIRESKGAGSRVSAATATPPGAGVDAIPEAEAAMTALGQTPLFMIRDGEEALDAALAAKGYQIKDPVTAYSCPVETIASGPVPHLTAITAWPPLAVQLEIWSEGGIGPARVAVMHRAPGPKTSILARIDDRPAGALFAAIHDGFLTVHAVETARRFRRRGLGQIMMRAAAIWGQDHGAHSFFLVTTRVNTAANALYTSLGMTPAAGYHYRIKDSA